MLSSAQASSRLAAGHLLAAGSYAPSPLWYATRATGVVALVLLTLTVALGVAGTARFSAEGLPRVVRSGLHRNVSLLAVAFVAMHVLSTVLDPYAHIGLISAVIPFSSSYRTFWLSLGTIAFDLLLAVVVTSLLRSRLSYRAWRAVHWLAYASWPVALWHGLGTGTDSRVSWLLLLDAACVLIVAAAVYWRLQLVRPGAPRSAGLLATAAFMIATVVFVAFGPLQPNWARRAGTPVALLGSSASVKPTEGRGLTLSARYTGRVTRHTGPASPLVIEVSGHTSAAPAQSLMIVLRGKPHGSGIDMSSGTVRLVAAAGGQAYAGPVRSLAGHRLVAELLGHGGQSELAHLTLTIRGSRASGQLVVRPGGVA